ncbi:MAG TPA: hypothetical protein PLX23_03530 [Candidatus Hydrogenedens sp.]|nr:hypothetical protein [Candidatus Hydrogenedens sp.]
MQALTRAGEAARRASRQNNLKVVSGLCLTSCKPNQQIIIILPAVQMSYT